MIRNKGRKFTRSITVLFATLASMALVASARADVQYTTQMSMNQNGKMVPFSTITTWRKAGLERVDTQQNLGLFRSSESTITRCAKREVLSFDPNLKIYTLESLAARRKAGMGGAGASTPSGKPGTGKMIMTASVKLINREKIAGRMTRHYRISQRMQTTGCCGTGDTSLQSEIWVADVTLPAFTCGGDPTDLSQAYNTGNCKVSYEQRGDWRALQAAYKGLLMKSVSRDASGKVVSQMQITKLSFAPLGAKSFEAPSGYSKVARADYDQKRREAMIAAMSKGTQ